MPKAAKSTRSSTRNPTRAGPAKPKDPKASHLYTDDNPATTIHGTGFKDKAAALRTLELISKRSLIYQFQTVNTMYNRAKHHPAMKKAVPGSANTADMRAAMEVFREWLDVTYPTARDALRAGGFKPLLSKKYVEQSLPIIERNAEVSEDAKRFARLYVALPKGKKLGNVLVDDSKPTSADWERKRYDALDALVPAGKEESAEASKPDGLWADGKGLLELFAWAWSPLRKAGGFEHYIIQLMLLGEQKLARGNRTDGGS